jgi:hypothetical protein
MYFKLVLNEGLKIVEIIEKSRSTLIWVAGPGEQNPGFMKKNQILFSSIF